MASSSKRGRGQNKCPSTPELGMHYQSTGKRRPVEGLEERQFRMWRSMLGRDRVGQIRTRIRTITQSHCPSPPPHSRDARGRLVTAHKEGRSRNRLGGHPSRHSFGTARRIPARGGGSHLGSSLNPRGAVLTGGVSRRSGSMACVRADASPNEVLAEECCTPHSREVNPHVRQLPILNESFIPFPKPPPRVDQVSFA